MKKLIQELRLLDAMVEADTSKVTSLKGYEILFAAVYASEKLLPYNSLVVSFDGEVAKLWLGDRGFSPTFDYTTLNVLAEWLEQGLE